MSAETKTAVATVPAEEHVAQLRELGLTAAANAAEGKIALKRKLSIAYEHYRYVTKEQIADYRAKLKEATKKVDGYTFTHADLRMQKLDAYPGVPPKEVLDALALAKSRECFDGFEIADVHSVSERIPDPILFGRIEGVSDRFAIADWGDDVRISDLLADNEG